MARAGNQTWGCLAIVAIMFAVIGQCSKGTDNAAPATAASSPSDGGEMYVEPASLNCRASPSAAADVVERLRRGDAVEVIETSGTWSQVKTLSAARCWVATRFLTEDAPEVSSAPRPTPRAHSSQPTYFASPAPERPRRSRSRVSQGGNCGSKRYCGEMNSCAEALHYLNQCGLGRLDRDGDGVPCESIC